MDKKTRKVNEIIGFLDFLNKENAEIVLPSKKSWIKMAIKMGVNKDDFHGFLILKLRGISIISVEGGVRDWVKRIQSLS